MEQYKFVRLCILLSIDDNEEKAWSEAFIAAKFWLNWEMDGCSLEGKLRERPWKSALDLTGENAIFCFVFEGANWRKMCCLM